MAALPWELGPGAMPWEIAGYPRTVSIKRPAAEITNGQVTYQGTTQASETLLYSGLPASIDIASAGRNTSASKIPDDSPGPIKYVVFIPTSAGSLTLQERDVVYDDLVSPGAPLGRRFQVDAWSPLALGYRLDCIRLEV